MMGKASVNAEREAIVESRKERHFADVNALTATLADHPNRAAAAYLMGIVSSMTNGQASRAALEAACNYGRITAVITAESMNRAVAIACADGDA
jgi:hypothetical protein